MVVLGHADTTLEKVIGFVAVLLGAGNAAGGYVVTERMLDMFKSSKKPAVSSQGTPPKTMPPTGTPTPDKSGAHS
jgi:NAD(P) transhydrogenase subunit alpha